MGLGRARKIQRLSERPWIPHATIRSLSDECINIKRIRYFFAVCVHIIRTKAPTSYRTGPLPASNLDKYIGE
jgi:hypothetical protein